MNLPFMHHDNKPADEQAPAVNDEVTTLVPAEPLTDEGITQPEVDKSEAFVNPLASEEVQKDLGDVALKIDAPTAGDAGEQLPAVTELQPVEVTAPEEVPVPAEQPVLETVEPALSEPVVASVTELPTEPAAPTEPVEAEQPANDDQKISA